MLIAKAAYAKGRKLVSKRFYFHIREVIPKIRDREDLKLYTNFYEAFMGFYRLQEQKAKEVI
jgi:CRISPR-associated protein Csm2